MKEYIVMKGSLLLMPYVKVSHICLGPAQNQK